MRQVDVLVVGGGPAGLSAALWAARYRRSVFLVDGGEQRNRLIRESHGYFGLDGISPGVLLERARVDLGAYATVDMVDGVHATSVAAEDGRFRVSFDSAEPLLASRLVLATGVRDVLPEIGNFFEHFGTSVFSCPSCDGFESQGKTAIVIGHGEQVAGFALSLLDWAESVTIVTGQGSCEVDSRDREVLDRHRIRVVEDEIVYLNGETGDLCSAVLCDGREIPCEVAFFTIGHRQRLDLFEQLGCEISDEGCVVVDADNQTTVRGVYAAGDITPGPHLIQVAAAEGAVAGVAAAQSLRGERGATDSPTPAPDPEAELSA